MRGLSSALLFALILAAAGCGGENGSEDRPSKAAAGEVKVTLDEYSITPRELVVARGATITAKNEGQLAHNFTVERGSDPDADAEDLAKTESFVGGESDRVRLDLAPGRYVTVCTVGTHRELGMVGTVTVK